MCTFGRTFLKSPLPGRDDCPVCDAAASHLVPRIQRAEVATRNELGCAGARTPVDVEHFDRWASGAKPPPNTLFGLWQSLSLGVRHSTHEFNLLNGGRYMSADPRALAARRGSRS